MEARLAVSEDGALDGGDGSPTGAASSTDRAAGPGLGHRVMSQVPQPEAPPAAQRHLHGQHYLGARQEDGAQCPQWPPSRCALAAISADS